MKRTFVFLALTLTHVQLPYAKTDVFAEDAKNTEIPPRLAKQLDQSGKLYAQLKIRQGIRLTSEMPGRVNRLHLRNGERFVAGQTLATISCPKEEANLKELKAIMGNYGQLKHQLDSSYSINTLEIDMANNEYQVARANVQVAETLLDRCSIKAPFSGTVIKLFAKAAQTVRTGDTLLEIMDNSQEVELLVPSNEIARVKVGQQYKVSADEKAKPYSVELLSMGGRVDPVSQTVKMYGRIADTTAKSTPSTDSMVALAEPK